MVTTSFRLIYLMLQTSSVKGLESLPHSRASTMPPAKMLLTKTSPAWPYFRARPGSEIRWGRPSLPHSRPALA